LRRVREWSGYRAVPLHGLAPAGNVQNLLFSGKGRCMAVLLCAALTPIFARRHQSFNRAILPVILLFQQHSLHKPTDDFPTPRTVMKDKYNRRQCNSAVYVLDSVRAKFVK
jgi:hypothetical protein